MPQNQSTIKVVKSFDVLLNGVAVSRASESVMLSVVCTEVRGDWKWQKDSGLHPFCYSVIIYSIYICYG